MRVDVLFISCTLLARWRGHILGLVASSPVHALHLHRAFGVSPPSRRSSTFIDFCRFLDLHVFLRQTPHQLIFIQCDSSTTLLSDLSTNVTRRGIHHSRPFIDRGDK